MQRKTYLLEVGIIFSSIFLVVFIVFVFINFTSPSYYCIPTGTARMADWLYPLKFWLTNYSECGFTIKDTIIPGLIWSIVGFCIGSVTGQYFKKKML